MRKTCKPRKSYPFLRNVYIYKKKSPLVRVSPFLYQEEENDKISRNSSMEKAMTNMHNNLILVYRVFPGNFP